MGTNLLSTDMLVSITLAPAVKAFTFKDYYTSSHLLYQFNTFMLGFTQDNFGITDLPEPTNPDQSDIADRRNPTGYYQLYYQKYAPLCYKVLGAYQRHVLDHIKDERGS